MTVHLAVRPWANVADYWDVFFGVNESIKEALNESGIKIPFPQMDVHVTNKNKNIEQK
jgi:small conductance mechanosensitive channel